MKDSLAWLIIVLLISITGKLSGMTGNNTMETVWSIVGWLATALGLVALFKEISKEKEP